MYILLKDRTEEAGACGEVYNKEHGGREDIEAAGEEIDAGQLHAGPDPRATEEEADGEPPERPVLDERWRERVLGVLRRVQGQAQPHQVHLLVDGVQGLQDRVPRVQQADVRALLCALHHLPLRVLRGMLLREQETGSRHRLLAVPQVRKGKRTQPHPHEGEAQQTQKQIELIDIQRYLFFYKRNIYKYLFPSFFSLHANIHQ